MQLSHRLLWGGGGCRLDECSCACQGPGIHWANSAKSLRERGKVGDSDQLVLIRDKPEMNNSNGKKRFFDPTFWISMERQLQKNYKKTKMVLKRTRESKEWRRHGEEMPETKQSNHKYIWAAESSQQLQSDWVLRS